MASEIPKVNCARKYQGSNKEIFEEIATYNDFAIDTLVIAGDHVHIFFYPFRLATPFPRWSGCSQVSVSTSYSRIALKSRTSCRKVDILFAPLATE